VDRRLIGSPRRSGTRALAATAVAGLLLGPVLGGAASPSTYADGLKAKKHRIEQHIRSANADLDESSDAVRRGTQRLLAARTSLGRARADLTRKQVQVTAARLVDRQMQARVDAAEIRLVQARDDLAQGRQDVADQTLLLRKLVVGSYQDGSPALLGLHSVLTSQNPAQLTGQLNSVATVVDKEATVLAKLQATKVMLAVREREVADAKAQVGVRRALSAEKLRLEQSLETQAQRATRRVSTMVRRLGQARTAALKVKRTDLRQLRQLRKERDRVARLIKQRASRTRRSYAGPATGNGFLQMPVAGPITSPFGWRTHPIFGYRSLHDGIDVGAACGLPLRAPADGKVIAEYYQTAWGNRLIIDHGVHYGVGVSTIVNHLSGYVANVGQRVGRGQVIGYVGTTGWSTGCHTHFTVMENGVPVNPMKWL
jgi:murein DD-endopeptidase MepM/ murein hydrolase activator NlpD